MTVGSYIVAEAPAITSVLQIAGWGKVGQCKTACSQVSQPLSEGFSSLSPKLHLFFLHLIVRFQVKG